MITLTTLDFVMLCATIFTAGIFVGILAVCVTACAKRAAESEKFFDEREIEFVESDIRYIDLTPMIQSSQRIRTPSIQTPLNQHSPRMR